VTNVVVRRSGIDDADALRTIRLMALLAEPDAFGSTYEDSLRYPATRWLEMARDWNYYLAFAGEEVIGMASGGRFDPRPDARWLYGMFVRPDHRGTGVAVELVHEVADWTRAQRVRTLGLHVTASVARARAFYEKIGFVPDGEHEPMERDRRLTLITMITDLMTNDRI
jgi:GNAT superfamily N-acetyltransferase